MNNNQTEIKHVLLTGANGLLGRQVTAKLHERGCNVYAIVRVQPDQPIAGVNYLEIDLGGDIPLSLLPKKIDAIFHLAQSSNFRDFPAMGRDIFAVNVVSVSQLLDYGYRSGCEHFIYTSTGGVYAKLASSIKENSPLSAIPDLGPYLGSKLCGEIIAQSYLTEMNISIFRPFFIYGPGQKRDMLLPRIFDRILNGELIQLQGKDGLTINPTHVEDAANIILACLENPQNSVLNIAGPEALSLREIANLIGQYLGREPMFEFVDGEAPNMVADITSLSENLGRPNRALSQYLSDLEP